MCDSASAPGRMTNAAPVFFPSKLMCSKKSWPGFDSIVDIRDLPSFRDFASSFSDPICSSCFLIPYLHHEFGIYTFNARKANIIVQKT